MANEAIRAAIRAAGLRQWAVADAYGLSDARFSVMLRHELDEEKRERVLAAIEKAKENKKGA